MSKKYRGYDAEYISFLITSSTEDVKDLDNFLKEIRTECIKKMEESYE